MNKMDAAERQARIAQRFKTERIRLGMTRRAVAALCGVSETAVVNWEHGGAKIPLLVLELLMPHGFSAESLVEFPEIPVPVRRLGIDGNTSGWTPVNLYDLKRCIVGKEDVFVYCEPATTGALGYVLGRAGLFRQVIDDVDVIKDVSGVFLLKRRRASKAFLCDISPAGKGAIRVGAGRLRKCIPAEKLFRECRPLGMYLGPVDELPSTKEDGSEKSSPHEGELRKVLG